MDELIVRAMQGDLNEDEERMLTQWRAASRANNRRYLAFAKLWRVLDLADPEAATRPSAADILARHAHSTAPAKAVRRHRFWIAGAAAAALVGGAVYLTARVPGPTALSPLQANEVLTGPSETTTTRLADGSLVRLAPNSRLVMTGRPGGREVWLEGVAFFAVAKQKGTPFVIRTHSGVATVLGTRFELRATAQTLRAVVVEGRVALGQAGKRVEVGAGEMSYLDRDAAPTVVEVPNPSDMFAWLGKVLLFKDTPLRQVALEIERHYQVRVEITDSSLANHLVSASFPERPVEQIVSVVCQILNADCSVESGVARIGRPR